MEEKIINEENEAMAPEILETSEDVVEIANVVEAEAEIAAEIIAYTKHSIGQGINDAKYGMDTPTVFAWTLIIIIFSVILEKVAKAVLGG